MEKHPLHLKDPELHQSGEVQAAVKKHERIEGEILPTARIDAYIDRLEDIFLNEDEHTRARNLDMLRARIYDTLIIKRDAVPEVYFELQRQVARERGHGDIYIDDDMREKMIDTIIEDQKHSLESWMAYLTSPDAVYPPWFKYFVWKNITKLSQFDKALGKFKERTKTTTAPFPDIFREPLALVCDVYEAVAGDNTKLKDIKVQEIFSRSFPKVYASKIQESLAHRIENREAIKGTWIHYEQGNTDDAARLYASLQGKGTGWCTAGQSTAETQIESGDFYVYYTENAQGEPIQPRIAIRMDGTDRIGEVRGILEHQALEPEMQDILDEKLKTFGHEADSYRKKLSDMKRVTSLTTKQQNGEAFTKDDLRFLYEVDNTIEGFGYNEDPRILELRAGRNNRADLATVFDCDQKRISLNVEEARSGGIVFHYGALDLSRLTSAEGLALPESVGGALYLSSLTSAEGLTLPESVGGYLSLSSLTNLEIAHLRTAYPNINIS